MRAGTLNRRVKIQQPVTTNGVQKWQDLVTVWAAVAPVSGTETVHQLGPTTVLMSHVTIRYQGSLLIKPKMRIQFGARTLEISSVLNVDERNRELDLVCREVVT